MRKPLNILNLAVVAAILCICILALTSCDQTVKHHQKHKVHRYIDKRDSLNVVYWNVIKAGEDFYYNASLQPITDYTNVKWVSSKEMPTVIGANRVVEEKEEEVEVNDLPDDIQNSIEFEDPESSEEAGDSDGGGADSGGDGGGGDGGD